MNSQDLAVALILLILVVCAYIAGEAGPGLFLRDFDGITDVERIPRAD